MTRDLGLVIRGSGFGMSRRGSRRGQTTTEYLMIAGIMTAYVPGLSGAIR